MYRKENDKMKNEVALKVYEVNYDFIIKNYLSPELWEKTWTLFVYKDINITLNIDYITVKPRKICFQVRIRQDEYSTYTNIYYTIDQSNLKILKKQINGAIETLMTYLENSYIQKEQGYKDIENAKWSERDLLRKIAEEFLDENDVTNKEIRDVYIENYISNNEKTYTYLSNYIDGRHYRCMPDMWLVYYKATENNEKYQQLLNKLSNELNFYELLKDIKESISIFDDENTDSDAYNEYVSDMKDCLESI